MVEAVLTAVAALVISVVLTGLMRRLALAHGVLDVPNERSSHSRATPRSGGVAIVLATTVAAATLVLRGIVDYDLFMALTGGGLAIAAIGLMDDYRSVTPGVRLAVHVAAACWALIWLGGLPPLRFGAHTLELGWFGQVLGVLGIVWTLNLFNFMDGVDGIAASEAIFVAGSGALLAVLLDIDPAGVAASLAFAAACAGFLAWNWPPARIFMGDVGSGYLGFALAVFALAQARRSDVALYVWFVLGAAFFVDATVTLLRRLLRGRRVFEAHRSHAYQRLARRWGSHRRITLAITLLNIVWLLPCAALAALLPHLAAWIALAVLLPLTAIVLGIGAGNDDDVDQP
jgi:Fuc2NAc and GlcNAc transferase